MTSHQEDVAHYRARAIAAAREDLRVAIQRSSDRRRLAENARAARQQAFAITLGEAADAHEARARAIASRLRALERDAAPGMMRRAGAVAR